MHADSMWVCPCNDQISLPGWSAGGCCRPQFGELNWEEVSRKGSKWLRDTGVVNCRSDAVVYCTVLWMWCIVIFWTEVLDLE